MATSSKEIAQRRRFNYHRFPQVPITAAIVKPEKWLCQRQLFYVKICRVVDCQYFNTCRRQHE